MAIVEGARLHERHRRQVALGDGVIKIERILQMRIAGRSVGHDGSGIKERIADVAIQISDRRDGWVLAEAGGGLEVVPALAEIRPRHTGLAERIADVSLLDHRRQRKLAVVGRIGGAAADESGDIVVEQIIGLRRAVRRRTWMASR